MLNTKGKTDKWGGYERVLGEKYEHYISKDQTQSLERTNGIIRQQTNIMDVPRALLWKSQRLLMASKAK